MKKFLILCFITSSIFAQIPTNTISKKISRTDLFTDYDIVLIDSLLMDTKYKSPLYDTSEYFIKNINDKKVEDVPLSTPILKERLQKIDFKRKIAKN